MHTTPAPPLRGTSRFFHESLLAAELLRDAPFLVSEGEDTSPSSLCTERLPSSITLPGVVRSLPSAAMAFNTYGQQDADLQPAFSEDPTPAGFLAFAHKINVAALLEDELLDLEGGGGAGEGADPQLLVRAKEVLSRFSGTT